MIVSFHHRFVFVAIPKTGSQAIRVSLRPVLAQGDWEQCTLFEQKSFPVEALAAIGHGHIEWRELEPYLLGQLRSMTSFAVVRDPFDRFASLARFEWRDEGDLPSDYLQRSKDLLIDPAKSQHVLLRPQYHFVCDDAGNVPVELLRYENLDDDFSALTARLGLALTPLQTVNASPAGRDFEYDDELRAMVRERYAEDFARFDYDPNGGAQ